MYEPCLQWVSVDGSVRHVSDFADLEPHQRPDAYCPVCGKTVILKLGDIRIHHAAHYEGAVCVTTQPETVVHLNSKYHIQKVLEATNKLMIWKECDGWATEYRKIPCIHESQTPVTYIEDWDRVEVEWQFGDYRLDVALLRGDNVVGAVEVLVTHPSEPGKLAYLNQKALAWVEIRVTPDFYTPPTAWTETIPLTPEKFNSSIVTRWQCEICDTSSKEYIEKAEETKRREEVQKKKREFAGTFDVELIRIIDFYFPSGKKYRKIYVIQKKFSQDNVLYIDLQEVTEGWRQIAVEHPPITAKSYEKLKQALEKELKTQQRTDWFIDKSRNWETKVSNYRIINYRNSDTHPYFYERVNDKWQRKQPKPKTRQERPPWKAFGVEIPYKTKQNTTSMLDDALATLFKEYTCTGCGKITSDWISGNGATKTCICRDCGYKK